jgi:prepilin-type N-terminal cleavage/methylation domain-containing protein
MKKQLGFSLIEVLVGSAIAALLGMVFYSFFATSQSQLGQISNRDRLLEVSDLLNNNMRLLAMSSSYVVNSKEYDSIFRIPPLNLDAITDTLNSDKALFLTTIEPNSPWKGLAVRNRWLYEKSGSTLSDTSFSWSVYMVGSDSIQLGSTRPFALLRGRDVIRFAPGYIRRSSKMSDSLFIPGLYLECKFGRL